MALAHNLKNGATSWRAARHDGQCGVRQTHLDRKQGAFYLDVRVGKTMARQSHVKQGQRHGKARQGKARQGGTSKGKWYGQIWSSRGRLDMGGQLWQWTCAAKSEGGKLWQWHWRGAVSKARLVAISALTQSSWAKIRHMLCTSSSWKTCAKHMGSSWQLQPLPRHADHGLKVCPRFCTLS